MVAVFILWVLASIITKRSVQAQTSGSRFFYLGVVFLGTMMIFDFNNCFITGWLTTRMIPHEIPYELCGGIFTIAGLFFSIWA